MMKAYRAVVLLLAMSAACTGFEVRVQAAQDQVAAKVPAVVFVIRHAEKPLVRDPDLAPMGYTRAAALPSLFVAKDGGPGRLPRPDAIFATAPSKKSNRPVETVLPLGQALHVRINALHMDDDAPGLARDVLSGKYAGKVVLICWHHGQIPAVVAALGVTDAPAKWDEGVFDQIWKIEWVGGKARMTMLPEELLKGDSTK